MGPIKVKASDINARHLSETLQKITRQMYVNGGDKSGGDNPVYGPYADETYIDFKEPPSWDAVLCDYKYNCRDGFDALDCLFDYLKKIKVSEKYVFSRGFLKDNYSPDRTISNKMETISEIIDILNSSSSGDESLSDIKEVFYNSLYIIREDYMFVKHSLPFDFLDISDDMLDRTKSLFGFYGLDVLSNGKESIKRELVYNPPENGLDEPYFKIEKGADALLCFPVDEKHRNLSIDLSVLESHINEDDIRTFVDRKLIEILNGNNNNFKVKLTPNGSFVRMGIFNKQKDKISGLLVPRDFLRPETSLKISELISLDKTII